MKEIKIILLFLCAITFVGCNKKNKNSDEISLTNKTIEKRINALLSKMTLEEKLGQMNQIHPYGSIEEMSALIKKGQVGSILNEIDPIRINAIQRVAVEESRLGIPILMSRDVIHGFKTIFPIPLGQGATFNPDIVKKGARIAAIEASEVGIRWTFAPMIDIARDPRWGRIAEGFGEDTYLTSVLGAAMVKGFQGDSLNNPTSIAACPKHFVGYGAAEGGRDYNSTFISERQLRNVYLPPFEAAVKAGAATFMTSFNDNDGVPSTGNSFTLKEILRREWGFDGFVVTDWASAKEMIEHGFADSEKEATMKAVNAGVDMEMVSSMFIKELPILIKENKVKEETINQAVRNILRIKFKLGLFDNPYVNSRQPKTWYSPNFLAVAKKAAEESVILLKNDKQILPLNTKIKRVAIVGPLADAPYEQLGTWVFDGDKNYSQTPLKAIKSLVGKDVEIIYEPGLTFSRDKNISGISKAIQAASSADIVLAFIGEESILSGEAHCLANLSLQGAQSNLIALLAKTGKPLVTIVMAGRPLTIENEIKASSAVLYAFHLGTMAGPALADLLWGKAVPSGKTPITFPKTVGQIPIYYSHHNTGRPANGEEVLLDNIPIEAGQTSLGCRSFYLDAGVESLYPFGYGLSYTTFKYSQITLSSNKLKKDDILTVTFKLENTGQYKGTEVAQLYVRDKIGSITRPVKELKRFTRVTLNPGESKKVIFKLPMSELAFWGINNIKSLESGEFSLWIATNSQSGQPYDFSIID